MRVWVPVWPIHNVDEDIYQAFNGSLPHRSISRQRGCPTGTIQSLATRLNRTCRTSPCEWHWSKHIYSNTFSALFYRFDNLVTGRKSDENDRKFEQEGHCNAQEDRAVDVRARCQECRGNPHTNVCRSPFLRQRFNCDKLNLRQEC